jgi:hypothetical protein
MIAELQLRSSPGRHLGPGGPVGARGNSPSLNQVSSSSIAVARGRHRALLRRGCLGCDLDRCLRCTRRTQPASRSGADWPASSACGAVLLAATLANPGLHHELQAVGTHQHVGAPVIAERALILGRPAAHDVLISAGGAAACRLCPPSSPPAPTLGMSASRKGPQPWPLN